MTGLIERLLKMRWRQRAALVALLLAYVVIAAPFIGVPWNRAYFLSVLLMFPGLAVIVFDSIGGVSGLRSSGSVRSGFAHLGWITLVMVMAWGQPFLPVARPHDPQDFQLFVWPLLIIVNMMRILSDPGSDRGAATVNEKPELA